MSDWKDLLEEGRLFQREEGILPPTVRPPSMMPWIVLAGLLIVISLGIELFWPLPDKHGPLPACSAVHAEASSCQKAPASGAPQPTVPHSSPQ